MNVKVKTKLSVKRKWRILGVLGYYLLHSTLIIVFPKTIQMVDRTVLCLRDNSMLLNYLCIIRGITAIFCENVHYD